MSTQAILTIEDDEAIRRGIVDALTFAGFKVFEAENGDDGRQLALTVAYDLLLLDLVLPGTGGLEILRQVRTARPTQAIIILTAKGDEDDRVEGLRLGADDYVVKPFGVKELLARVAAVLRRSPERPGDIHHVPVSKGIVDLARREVRFESGTRCELSDREIELLRYLASNSGRAISRDEILSNVWRISPAGVSTRTIDMHVARLREKLGDDPENPSVILTVRGTGYMYAQPIAAAQPLKNSNDTSE